MEQKKTRNIILSCIVILVIACVLVGLIGVGGLGVALIWPFNRTTTTDSVTPAGEVTVAPTDAVTAEAPTETSEAAPESEIPEAWVTAMKTIEEQVATLRGLSSTNPVDWDLISEAELEEIVREDFFADYSDEDAVRDAQILAALGLLPQDYDLKQLYTDLYSEQIAGFYDDEIEAMYVVQGEGFGGAEKLTYAHEFTHVLQDQNFDLDEGLQLNDEACEADSERCAAVQALIEGDASLSEMLWFQTYATRKDYNDLMEAYESYDSPVLDSAPPYMVTDLYFPYEKGQIFVELLYNAGGYDAVDEAFVNVPVSTEQILHPERYPEDVPVSVSLPDLTDVLGGDWYVYDENVMGEWYTYLILNMAYDTDFQLPESTAADAAEGWGGDAYAFYLNPDTDEVVFVMDTVWDTTQDEDEFTNAFIEYAGQRWDPGATSSVRSWTGVEGTVVFWQDGDRTVWVIAPTFEMATAILAEVQ